MTRRVSIGLMLVGSLALGQTLDSRLHELTRKLPSHSTAAPTTAHRLGEGMEQIRATLAHLADGDNSAPLRDEHRKLLSLDEAYQAEFGRIESTLRRAGLTPAELDKKLALWHGFTAHYRQRMDASLAGFDRLGRVGASKREIAALRAGLGEPGISPMKQAPAPPVTLSVLNSPAQAEDPQTAASDPPTPAALAETSVVKLSPDIRALAAALGNSPTAIYAYVYNNIRWVPYYLAMQNSEAVMWSKRGNDADQATLLIALLRAAGIPARYVTANINISVADAINWTGAKDYAGCIRLLLASTVGTVLGSDQFQIQHTWVEGWVDKGDGNGPAWIALAPAIKKQTFQPGLQLPIPIFDRLQFLSALTTRLSTDVYADQIHAALAKNFPGRDLSELAYTGTIVPAAADKLPAFPYTPSTVFTRAAALPASSEWKETLTISDYVSNQVYLSVSFFLPEISLQSISISYTAATLADQKVIDSFGGLDKVPAGMVNLLAQIRLDDAVYATSTVPVPTYQALNVTPSLTAPNGTAPRAIISHFAFASEHSAIALAGPQLGDTWIGSRIDGLLAKLPTAPLDTVLRETLFLAGLFHNQQMQTEWASIFLPLQYVADYSLQVPFSTHTHASNGVTKLFDRPFLAAAAYFDMDDGIIPPLPFNLNGNTAADINVYQAVNVARSQSECQTWERLELISTACTINALQTASQNNIRLLTINQANSAALLPTIASLDPALLGILQGELQFGITITIPQRPVTLKKWTGFPYIGDWPNFYDGSFFIVNQIHGVYTTDDPNTTPAPTDEGVKGDPKGLNNTTCSDPVNVSNGNMFQQETDLAISSRGPAFVLARAYNSLSAANNGPFGYGWTHSYTTSLKDNGSTVTLMTGSGGVYAFVLQNGTYVSPTGLNLKLTKDAQGYTIRTKHGAQSRFDTNGVLQSIADRNQNTMKLGYDTTGRLTTLTDSLNRVVTLSYDTGNHIVSAQDFSSRRVTYSYDGAGNLVSVTDFAGNRTAYAYYTDSVFNHLLRTVTKPAGNSTSFEYYVNKHTARISDSAGRNMRLLYLPLSHQTIFIDARGFATSFYYDALGEVTRVVKADGNYVDTAFTADAKTASITDENGRVTQFAYDALGNMTSAVDALGRTVKLVYEPNFNLLASVTDVAGKVTTFQYDTRGNLVHIIHPLGAESRLVYDSFGELISGTDAEGNTTNFAYDSNGNPITLTDPLGNATQLKFDQLRRPIGASDAMGDTGSLQFDVLDRPTKVTDPLGNSSSAIYDPNGNLAQTIDPNGRSTRFSYDTLDNLAQVTDAKAGVTQYGYSAPGCGCNSDSDLIAYRNAAGETKSHTYDFNHWLTQATDAAGASTAFVYNSRGDIIQRTDANGNTVKFEYDAVHRLTHKIFPDGSDARFSYDTSGNLTSAVNTNAFLTFGYDDLSRLTSATDSRFGKTIQYGYNRNSQRTTRTDSEGGVTSYAYDAAGNLKAIINPTGGSVQVSYDALNRPSTLAYSNGLGASAAYDAAGRVTAISYGGVQSGSMAASRQNRLNAKRRDAGSAFAQFLYSYDQNGNSTAIADLTGTHSYQFDELNRLTAAAHPTLNAETYGYDGAGNRTSSANDPSYSYDSLGRLTKAEGVAYSYDANGNLTNRTDSNGTTMYTYDYDNQLTGIAFPDGTTAAYLYDVFGRRIQKNVNGSVTNYLYDGVHILLELDSGGAMQARYTHGPGVDHPLMMERGSQTYFYHSDAIGSIAAVTDSSGNTACVYLYDSFGRTQPCQGVTTPFGFAGREYDVESGLYYMRARYYDPATGRFLSSDPLDLTGRLLSGGAGAMGSPQHLNRYSYAVNNPLALRDPSGLGCDTGALEAQLATLLAGGEVGSALTKLEGDIAAGLAALLPRKGLDPTFEVRRQALELDLKQRRDAEGFGTPVVGPGYQDAAVMIHMKQDPATFAARVQEAELSLAQARAAESEGTVVVDPGFQDAAAMLKTKPDPAAFEVRRQALEQSLAQARDAQGYGTVVTDVPKPPTRVSWFNTSR